MLEIRKRGADMTQALLYAAFAIIVLISVLAMYQVVTFNSKKVEATQVMTVLSNELRTLSQYDPQMTDAKVINAGILPTQNVSGNTMTIPYGGLIGVNYATPVAGTKLNLVLQWPESTRGSGNLCNYLTAGSDASEPGKIIANGPLGSDYSIQGDCAEIDLGAGAGSFFWVMYH